MSNELKILFQELNENPYRRLNVAFFLISVIPTLVFAYILFGKIFLENEILADTWIVLFFAGLILVLGYCVAYNVIKNVINKTVAYAAKAKKADETKSTFAMALAHDLKSPIATIKANISNLKAGFLGTLTREQEEAVGTCKDVADRMNSITTQLIDAYVIEARMAELNIVIFDIRPLIEDQKRELASLASTKNIELTIDLCQDPLLVNGDREKILRAVNNLLSNSIKHTPINGKIRVCAHKTDGFARIEFLNTGAFIPSDKLEKIFDKFERLNALIEGHGLGLSIAKDIVELHKGKVWATSEEGKPNCFTMLLALQEDAL